MSFVFVALGFLAFLAASMLAIDVGMLMVSRTQAQTAADAGALAGATALAFNSFTDHTPTGPAVSGAVNTAQANLVAGGAPSVTPGDVTFPFDATTAAFDQVQVSVYRTKARNNPLPTFIATYFGTPTVDVGATATAAAMPANTESCVKPWTIPDKWIEKQCAIETCPWTPDDSFDLFDSSGNPLPNPDVYIPIGQPGYTGYNPDTDKGLELIIKPNNANKTSPSFYNEWAIPPGRGGNWYRQNIAQCNNYIQPIGDLMTDEPGNKVGPTDQGTQALIDLDPNAYWDTSCNCVKGSAFATSPRVVAIPAYDPVYYATGKQNGRNASLKVANWVGLFVETVGGGQVTGRITPILGTFKPGGPLIPNGFARALMLVQ